MDGVPLDIRSPERFGHRPPPYEINGMQGEEEKSLLLENDRSWRGVEKRGQQGATNHDRRYDEGG